MTTAAVYARISDDDLGLGKGVARQLEDARQLAQQREWDVVGEYVDNDVSAYNGDARKQYQQLMRDAEAGRFDRIVVYMTSRLWRNRAERAAAITRLGQLRIGVAAVRGPELELTTAAGRMIAGVLGEFDTMESEVKGERVARAALQRAQEGRANGAVLYGWRREYETDSSGRIVGFHDVENSEEAAIVREIVDRLLARETLGGVTRDLNTRGIPTPGGRKRWHHSMVTGLVMRAANLGLRVHKGTVIGPAAWPAIVDRDKYDRIIALLKAPERRQTRDASRKYLLSYGVGECGVCGSALRVKRVRRSYGRYVVYDCEAGGHVARSLEQVDELVSAVVVERLLQPDAAGIFDGDDKASRAARERAEAIRARLDTAADEYAAGRIDAQQLSRITARLRPELEAAEEEARRTRRVPLPALADGLLQREHAEATWAPLPVTAKRAVLETLGLRILIQPRRKSGPGFDPREIEFVWRG